MKYSLISGELPDGIHMHPQSTHLVLSGVTQLNFELFEPPHFETNADLGAVGEHEEFETNIEVSVAEGRTLMGINLVNGHLPWGTEFDGTTIKGTVAELLDRWATFYTDAESPKWNTPSGLLGTVGEGETAIFPISYTDGDRVELIDGNLPWGFEANATAISGTAAELVGVVDPYVNTLGPVWTTQAGMLGSFDEFERVNLSVTARPRNEGDNVNIHLVRGYLPYGLELTPSSGSMVGVITGTIDELRAAIPQYGPFNNPRIDTTSLPKMHTGVPFIGQINVTAYAGRGYGVISDNLPWGLELSLDGKLTGVPREAGEFDVRFIVQDDAYLFTSKLIKVVIV